MGGSAGADKDTMGSKDTDRVKSWTCELLRYWLTFWPSCKRSSIFGDCRYLFESSLKVVPHALKAGEWLLTLTFQTIIGAIQPGMGWLAFVQRNRNPQPLRRACICTFLHKNGTKAGWLSLTAPRKLYKNRMTVVESSTKAGSGWLSLKALRKQDDFYWKLYESRMTFV